ncbi:PREDICTED: neuronal PAS domain-containing protein 4-like [Cyprinodon variegatus]|uniref:neuronal PAS domain-containing protein 4-like n=1 Tax=Cyprinodon variegatus TaxID=28743 RepID=UPI0007426BCC|nr:PREDICTED: neuronal PAS domain-containing protein 4-like [Cyprinodon variegatus]
MALWCNACKCVVSSPCTSHHLSGDARRAANSRSRSTKGASKARRDHINREIRNMRSLLPITQEDQERLSYLHSMAAICTYIRKSVLFQGLPAGERSPCSLQYEAFLEALHGFILVTTAQGRLVYVSENVAKYIGLSMVDVLQGDSFYDLVEHSDVDIVKSNLNMGSNLFSERSFVCCMQTTKAFKLQHGSCCSMLVRGSFQFLPQPSSTASPNAEPLFVALCTPTVNRLTGADSHFCPSFSSTHRLDMSFTQVSESVLYYVGYSAEEMINRSWYNLLHPGDLSLAAASHKSLMQAEEGFQVEMILRLQCRDLSWTWIYIRANKDPECQSISCTNYIISETEAIFLQKKISVSAFKPLSVPNFLCSAQEVPQSQSISAKCFKRRRMCSSQSEELEAKTRRESEQDVFCALCPSSQGSSSPVPLEENPALFTPPYSPASSSSPLQQEELNPDLLMDAHGCKDPLQSSPEASPSYYSYQNVGLSCHQSPADSLQMTEQEFERRDFDMFSSSSSSTSPVTLSQNYDFQACSANSRLVPDSFSMSEMCESQVECASLHPDDFSLLDDPTWGSLVPPLQMPHQEILMHSSILTPIQSPVAPELYLYDEREQEEISILAQQISSLFSSFDMHHGQNPLQNVAPVANADCDLLQASPLPLTLHPKHEPVYDDCTLDSILKDLNMVSRKSSAPSPDMSYSYQQGPASGNSLPAEQLSKSSIALDPFGVQLGSHDQNVGLHQLNHYMQSSFQQDGLAEETLY